MFLFLFCDINLKNVPAPPSKNWQPQPPPPPGQDEETENVPIVNPPQDHPPRPDGQYVIKKINPKPVQNMTNQSDQNPTTENVNEKFDLGKRNHANFESIPENENINQEEDLEMKMKKANIENNNFDSKLPDDNFTSKDIILLKDFELFRYVVRILYFEETAFIFEYIRKSRLIYRQKDLFIFVRNA